MAYCCVNLSGQSWPVIDGQRQQIGEILSREFFTRIGAEGSMTAIYFMGPSGAMLNGYLQDPPISIFGSLMEHPYKANVDPGDGKRYSAFIMRDQMTLYDYYGNVVGSVAAGKMVLCDSNLAGTTMNYLKSIKYAEKRSGGWDPMYESEFRPHGFVDTGMRTNPNWYGIALYGSW